MVPCLQTGQLLLQTRTLLVSYATTSKTIRITPNRLTRALEKHANWTSGKVAVRMCTRRDDEHEWIHVTAPCQHGVTTTRRGTKHATALPEQKSRTETVIRGSSANFERGRLPIAAQLGFGLGAEARFYGRASGRGAPPKNQRR